MTESHQQRLSPSPAQQLMPFADFRKMNARLKKLAWPSGPVEQPTALYPVKLVGLGLSLLVPLFRAPRGVLCQAIERQNPR